MAFLPFWQFDSGETGHPIEQVITLIEKITFLILQLVVQLFANQAVRLRLSLVLLNVILSEDICDALSAVASLQLKPVERYILIINVSADCKAFHMPKIFFLIFFLVRHDLSFSVCSNKMIFLSGLRGKAFQLIEQSVKKRTHKLQCLVKLQRFSTGFTIALSFFF